MKYLLALILLLIPIQAKADLADIVNATAKVHCQSGTSLSTGTGVVFGIKDGLVYIITNSHVVSDNPKGVDCIFYKWGHRSRQFRATVIFNVKNREADIAILTVPQAEFKGMEPKPIPIAPYGTKINTGACLWTNGCAKGAEPSLIATREIKDDGVTLEFRPPPQEGRSGSGMFNREGTAIVGLLYARSIEENAVGMAVSLEILHKYIYKKTSVHNDIAVEIKPHVLLPYKTEPQIKPHVLLPYLEERKIQLLQYPWDETQCPGGNCPLVPRRPNQRPQPRPTQPGPDYGEKLDGDNPFPTYPGETEAKPEVKEVPKANIEKKKDEIKEWVKEHKHFVFLGIMGLVLIVGHIALSKKQ